MSRTAHLTALLALAAACCSDPPAPPAPGTGVGTGTNDVPPGPPPTESDRHERIIEEQRKEADTVARGLLASFESRVYDPRRDSLLEHAEGTVRVTTDAGEASYRFVFDSSHPPERPVRFEVVSEPDEAWGRTTTEVRNWANLTCIGAFPVVAYYRPPVPLEIVPSNDRKNVIVLAPVFRKPLTVSYSFDERQVVAARAEWSDAERRYVTDYEWETFGGGRYVLRRAVLHQGATTEFVYGDREGVRVLNVVRVKGGDRPLEAAFTYQAIRRVTR